MPVRTPQFTPEQLETLKAFADHVRTGRYFLKFVFMLTAAVGAVATTVIAWFTIYPHH